MIKEFKEFALKGNIIDLAIGVVIGGAFSSLINSIVNDLITPIIGLITSGVDFSNMYIQLSGAPKDTLAQAKQTGATIAYGNFLTLLINFIIVAWILFIVMKGLNKVRRMQEQTTSAKSDKSATIPRDEQLLTEIRDLLAKEHTIPKDHNMPIRKK